MLKPIDNNVQQIIVSMLGKLRPRKGSRCLSRCLQKAVSQNEPRPTRFMFIDFP